eukprot:jgi/Mesen1/4354/ME000022S03634
MLCIKTPLPASQLLYSGLLLPSKASPRRLLAISPSIPSRKESHLGSLRTVKPLTQSWCFATRSIFTNSSTTATSGAAIKMSSEANNMKGKVCIVTGANTGMGVVIAKELALKGASVVMACRSEAKGKAAQDLVLRAVKARGAEGKAEFASLDLSSLASVRAFADGFIRQHGQLDCLINNAGIMVPPHSYTADGFESQFQVNYLSHYLLTRLLLPVMEKSAGTPSIVHVSSLAGERVSLKKGEFGSIARCGPGEYEAFKAYRQSKLAQVLFTVEMNRRLGDKVTVNAVHPGIVNTDLFNRGSNPLLKMLIGPLGWVMQATGAVYTPAKGASTAIYLATTPRSVTGSGGYFADCAPKPANPVALDPALGEEWWNESARAAGIDP